MKERFSGETAILVPRGYLLGGDETEDLDRTIQSLALRGNLQLVIDLSETCYMTTPALSVLLAAHKIYEARGGHVVLCNVDRRIDKIFVITRLCLVFDVAPSLVEALDAFAKQSTARGSLAEAAGA